VGTVVTSVVTGAVIVLFAVTGRDPILHLFFWFSGLAVLAIVLVEILVSIAVIAYFRREGDDRYWNTVIAPALAIVGLVLATYLIIARFGLLAGTVAEGVDPTTQSFGLSAVGWILVLAPFVTFVVGMAVGTARRSSENQQAIADLVTCADSRPVARQPLRGAAGQRCVWARPRTRSEPNDCVRCGHEALGGGP
jgi:amino acid transporter